MIRLLILTVALAVFAGCDKQDNFPPQAPVQPAAIVPAAPQLPTVTPLSTVVIHEPAPLPPDETTTITLPGGGTVKVPKGQPTEITRDIDGKGEGPVTNDKEDASGKGNKIVFQGDKEIKAEIVQGPPSSALGALAGANGFSTQAAAATGSQLSTKFSVVGVPPQQWGGYLLGFIFIIGGAAAWYFFPTSNMGKYMIAGGIAIIALSTMIDKYPLVLVGIAVVALVIYLLPHIEAYIQQKKATKTTATLGTVLKGVQTHEDSGGTVSVADAIQHNTDTSLASDVNSIISKVKTDLNITPIDPLIKAHAALAQAKAAPVVAATAQQAAMLGFPTPGTYVPPLVPTTAPAGAAVPSTPVASITTTFHPPTGATV